MSRCRRLAVPALALLACAPTAAAATTLRFDALPPVATAAGPQVPVVADVDRDGSPDVLVPAYLANVVSVLPGNGDGTLGARLDYPAGPTPIAIAASEDLRWALHRVDVVVANSTGGWSFLDNDGAGSLLKRGPAGSPTFPLGSASWDIALVHAQPPLADVALAAASPTGDGGGVGGGRNTCDILVDQYCVGAFSQLTVGIVASEATPIALDVREDGGAWEAVVADSHNATVRLARLNVAGSQWGVSGEPLQTAGVPQDVAYIDADGDGGLDVLAADPVTGGVELFRRRMGGFDRTLVASGCVDAVRLAVGDLDRDGKEDFAVACLNGTADDEVQVHRGLGGGTFRVGPILRGGRMTGIALGDLDGDRALDVIVASSRGATVTVFRSTPAPAASPTRVAFAERDALTTSPPVVVRVVNGGAGDAVLQSARFTGPGADAFGIVENGCIGGTGAPTPVGPADSCPLRVAFAPRALGRADATLELSFARGGPVRVPVVGTGVQPGKPRLTGVRAAAGVQRRGVVVRLELSRSASVTATLARKKGRRWKALATVARRRGIGASSIAFGPKLTVGRYRVRLVAVDASGRKGSATATFRVRRG